jgi:uncharacterized membrane protein YfcA
MQAGLTILSGSVVGFSLGLIGGGGSILAVPLPRRGDREMQGPRSKYQ